jgi:acetyl esterase/lipase
MLKLNILFSLLLLLVFSACKKETQNNHSNNSGNSMDTVLYNVSYGPDAKQVYDIYLPNQRDTSTPVIVMIHGGAWKAGQKEDFNYYIKLIQAKWPEAAIANINYRLASNANQIHHDEIMSDIDSAIQHVIQRKSTYQISSNIGLVGASAGGQLAMIYAYKYNSDIKCIANFFGPSIINDWAWYNSNNLWLGGKVGNILQEYVGQSWDSAAYSNVSPYWNVNANSQPSIIFHGNLDPIVPVYQSQWMKGKLIQLGVPNQYHEYVAFHGFDNTQSEDAILKMTNFFKLYLK